MKKKRSKFIVGGLLALALVFGLVAPALAAVSTVTITSPLEGAPVYVQPGASVDIGYTVNTDETADGDVRFEVYQPGFTLTTETISVTFNAGVNSLSYELGLPYGAPDGIYNLAVRARQPSSQSWIPSDPQLNAIVVDSAVPTDVSSISPDDGSYQKSRGEQDICVLGVHDGQMMADTITLNYKLGAAEWATKTMAALGSVGADANYTCTIDDSGLDDGDQVQFYITGADEAGNAIPGSVGGSQSVPLATYTIDDTEPTLQKTLTGTLGDNGWYTTDVIVTLTAGDATSGAKDIRYDIGAGWTEYTDPFTISDEGTTTLGHFVTDNAGNIYTLTPQSIKIDKTVPTLEKALAGTLGDNGWYTTDVTVTLTADDATSGAASIEYKYGAMDWTVYTDPFTISDEGTTALYHRATDNAGNVYELTTQDIKIDKTAPAAPANLAATVGAGAISLTWETATDEGSGIAGYNAYRGTVSGSYDGSAINSSGLITELSYPDATGTPGTIYYYVVKAVDKAGNEGDASDEASATFEAGAPASVTVTSNRPGGMRPGQDCTITATVKDLYDHPVADATVTFETTLGAVRPPTRTTNSSGIAQTSLDRGTVTGIATVTATSDSASGYVEVEFLSSYVGKGITVTADPGVILANGEATSTITVTLTDEYGNPVTHWGSPIHLETTAGTLNPESGTTTDGIFTSTLISSTTPTVATVTVNAGDLCQDSVDVEFTQLPPAPPAPPLVTFMPQELPINIVLSHLRTAHVVLDKAPDGLSGYEITVSLSDTSIAEIVRVDLPDWAALSEKSALPADSVVIKAADVGNGVQGGATSIMLAAVTFRGDIVGSSGITVLVTKMDDDNGGTMAVDTANGQIWVTAGVIPLPCLTNLPTNPDADPDELYEDLNGNGVLDFNDVVLFFDHVEWIQLNEPVSCFDFNGNGRIDFDDVVDVFDLI